MEFASIADPPLIRKVRKVSDFAVGRLSVNHWPDNPYFDHQDERASDFHIVLERGPDGEWAPRVAGFRFLGSLYTRQR